MRPNHRCPHLLRMCSVCAYLKLVLGSDKPFMNILCAKSNAMHSFVDQMCCGDEVDERQTGSSSSLAVEIRGMSSVKASRRSLSEVTAKSTPDLRCDLNKCRKACHQRFCKATTSDLFNAPRFINHSYSA